MKVLWLSNIVFPEAESLLKGSGELKSTGGWMVAAAKELVKEKGISLAVASISSRVKDLRCLNGVEITYYLIPKSRKDNGQGYCKAYEQFCKRIHDEYLPDVTHIHGTENPFGLAYVNACGGCNVVVSIQGLISIIADYYNYGLSKSDIYHNLTIRDLFKGNLLRHQIKLKKKSKLEISLLQKVSHVIGRTSWDKAHTWAINPDLNYHFCNETLREEFYTGCWRYEDCVLHTIFVSQASYPVKGVHQLFKALPLIIQHFPNTQIRIAGVKSSTGFIQKMITGKGYSRYLLNLADKLAIQDHITYLGPLNAEQMKAEYLRANVFVSPSTIENSPNSLGEAQMLGVPCVSSYVGGTMDMVQNIDCGELYRFEDYEMLAYKVCNYFGNAASFNNSLMRGIAALRHDPQKNAQVLLSIYHTIIFN